MLSKTLSFLTLAALLLQLGCESDEGGSRTQATQRPPTKHLSSPDTNRSDANRNDTTRSNTPRRTPDRELLARPPRSPISLIRVMDPSPTDMLPSRPFVEEKHATGGGLLRFDGKCLFLESRSDRVGLVFKNESARFDERSKELVVSGVRVRVDEALFVRATWWGGPSFAGFELTPPQPDGCARDTYWLVDTIGVGLPSSRQLNCEGQVDTNRGSKVSIEDFAVSGGLKQDAERTFRLWRQNFGIIRVCGDKHLPRRIGTMLDEKLTVDISESGHVTKLAFQESDHADLVECMQGYMDEITLFPPAKPATQLTLQLQILLGNSDYQIAACDELRRQSR